tara:strand:- start:458 stop:1063 length:606 start_codon:yes stop_codon:yes gene_type:complete
VTELVTYKGQFCERRTDFVWGRQIPDEICDGLLEFWENQRFLPVTPGQVYDQGEIGVNKDLKDSMDVHIPHQIGMPMIQDYREALQGVLNDYCEKFPFCQTSRFQMVEPMSLQCYPIGGGFKEWHTERLSPLPGNIYRHLVFMTYLNDVPDGGTEWYHQDLYIPAKKGYTVVWPADWTHFHRGRVSETSEKKIITGWLSYI